MAEELWKAAHMGTEEDVKDILEQDGLQYINWKNPESLGQTPIWVAAHSGDTDIVKILGEAGGDVNLKDQEGWFPIHAAASEGHVDTVEALIDLGAWLDLENNDGDTPQEVARTDEIKTLIENAIKKELGDI